MLEQYPNYLRKRIETPSKRGNFTRKDSSETQLGLLSASNGEGALYFLLTPEKTEVRKAKFLSFGKLISLPLLDAFCEWVEGRTVEELSDWAPLSLKNEFCPEGALDTAVLCEEDFLFLGELRDRALAKLDDVRVEAAVEEKDKAYNRKDRGDMTVEDLAWLPLSAPEKIERASALIEGVVKKKSQYAPSEIYIYTIYRDLEIQVSFGDSVEGSHRALILGQIEAASRSELHHEIIAKEAP